MSQSIRSLAREVVASPLGDVIAAVGQGVAAAQQALDDASLAKTLEIYGDAGAEAHQLLREIGYRPTFYVLPETTGEVHVSLTLGGESQGAARPARGIVPRARIYATPVDAGFANRFAFQAQVSAKLTFRIVPVPPPAGTEELRAMPELVGLAQKPTPERAAAALRSLGLAVQIEGPDGTVLDSVPAAGEVTAQRPEAGTILRAGDEVTLTVKPAA
jgi:hypothetical protein